VRHSDCVADCIGIKYNRQEENRSYQGSPLEFLVQNQRHEQAEEDNQQHVKKHVENRACEFLRKRRVNKQGFSEICKPCPCCFIAGFRAYCDVGKAELNRHNQAAKIEDYKTDDEGRYEQQTSNRPFVR
jgi:hypothetical protein